MNFSTSFLCDEYKDSITVAESSLFQFYGNKKAFSGPVVTVKVYEDYGLIKDVIEEAAEGSVIVIHGSGSRRSALIGKELVEQALKNGVSGFVVYGCIRDSAIINDSNIGMLAIGTNPVLSSKDRVGEKNVSFHFASVDWTPGSYVYVDQDGMVVSKKDLLIG